MKFKRMTMWLLGFGAVGALTFLFLKARPLDYEMYSRLDDRLHMMKSLENELASEIRKARFDLKRSEVDLMKVNERLMGVYHDLAHGHGSILELEDLRINTNLSQYENKLRQQEEALSKFTESNVKLKESQDRLPASILVTGDDCPAIFQDIESALIISGTVIDLLTYEPLSDEDPWPRMLKNLDRLKEKRSGLEGKALAALDRLTATIEEVMLLKVETDIAYGQLTRISLGEHSNAIFDAYRNTFEGKLVSTDVYRLYLYVFSVLMLGKIAHAMIMLKRSASKLNEAKETLEQKVEGRTQLLSKANAELGTEIAVRKLAEYEAKEARQASEEANKTKSEFLANMSHEIRTPMTAILGFSERLSDKDVDEETRNTISTIRRNGDYLLQLINDILDLSKIEAGKLEVENIPCSPFQILAEVQSMMSVRAESKGLKLNVKFDGKIPNSVQSDPTRLRQILINLVGNAVKFTERGGVHVNVRFIDEKDAEAKGLPPRRDGVYLQFDVSDTGIGLEDEQVQMLFKPFTQADSSTTRKFGGTGLGLSITKHLVTLLGGSIHVESTPDVGTSFVFCVSTGDLEGVEMVEGAAGMVLASEQSTTPSNDASLSLSCRILLVEDGEDNQRLMSYVLEKVGAEVELGTNGQEGVKKALAALRSDEPYDVILMDMQMPILDGYAATTKLRESGYTRPIIALTAHAMATDRERCIQAGCDEFCTKPINRTLLINTIARFLGDDKKTLSEATPASNKAPVVEVEAGAGAEPVVEDVIVSEFADDEDMLELIQMFVDELDEDIQTMQTAIADNDLQTLATVAHQLRGSAGGYGFPTLTEQAALIEDSARGRREAGTLPDDVKHFAELCSRARAC